MKNKEILELKNSQSVTTHLTFIQGIINRMAGNSANCKILVSTILTVAVTVLLGFNNYNKYWWITIIIILYGLISDAYYLTYERKFREEYNNFVYKINRGQLQIKDIYIIKNIKGNCYCEFPIKMIKSMASFSVWTYYITLGIVCYIITII